MKALLKSMFGAISIVALTVPATAGEKKKDIVATAVDAGSFTTLVAAVKAADLADALKGDGPFTVFAPTDEAFKKLPDGTVESLLKPENKEKLATILKYHVVSGKVMAEKAITLSEADTLADQKLKLAVKDGSLHLNDTAKVVTADVKASNGVIHVVDTVILPPDDNS